jgi:hypothetical protein
MDLIQKMIKMRNIDFPDQTLSPWISFNYCLCNEHKSASYSLCNELKAAFIGCDLLPNTKKYQDIDCCFFCGCINVESWLYLIHNQSCSIRNDNEDSNK